MEYQLKSQGEKVAIVLAGGLGTRLRSVVPDMPKVMALVNGKPFLEYILMQLADNMIEKVIICTGYMSEQIISYFGDRYRYMQLIYSDESSPLGTGGALRNAVDLIDSPRVFVLNGDSFCTCNYSNLLKFHVNKCASLSVGVVSVNDASRYGSIKLDDSGRVIGFLEKGQQDKAGMINAGIYLIERSVIGNMPAGCNFSLEKQLFPQLVGQSIYGYKLDSKFIDIGVPADYAASQWFFQ